MATLCVSLEGRSPRCTAPCLRRELGYLLASKQTSGLWRQGLYNSLQGTVGLHVRVSSGGCFFRSVGAQTISQVPA